MELKTATFTSYLGVLANEQGVSVSGLPMNSSSLQVKTPVSKELLGQYEAILTYFAYHSRLVYEPKVRKVIRMFEFLHYSPLVFNKILSMITYGTVDKTNAKRIESGAGKQSQGSFFYDLQSDLPAYIAVFDYTKPGASKLFPQEKILVVSFRGTLTLRTLIKDMNIAVETLTSVYGPELFAELAPAIERVRQEGVVSKFVNPFGAHRGFVSGMQRLYAKCVEKIQELLAQNPDVKRIFITGHSLGGAYTNLFALGLAQEKRKYNKFPNQSIHAITYGAPMTFTGLARDVFNGLLEEGYLTLDRVINSSRFTDPTFLTTDIIGAIPPTLRHPGFKIETGEIKSQSRTGRTRHIRELRSELANIQRKQAWYSFDKAASRNYNALPYYPEFFSKFKDADVDPSFTAAEYKSLLHSTLHGTVRTGMGPASKVIAICKRLTGLSDADVVSAEEKQAAQDKKEEDLAKEAAAKDPLGPPPEVVRNEQEAAKKIKNAYAETGIAVPSEENQAGGALEVNWKRNKEFQPNTIVYSCYQLTGQFTPLPWLTCHVGYMGVSWVGLALQLSFGTGFTRQSRDYKETALLFVDPTGKWTYLPDMMQGGKRKTTNTRKRKSSTKRHLKTRHRR